MKKIICYKRLFECWRFRIRSHMRLGGYKPSPIPIPPRAWATVLPLPSLAAEAAAGCVYTCCNRNYTPCRLQVNGTVLQFPCMRLPHASVGFRGLKQMVKRQFNTTSLPIKSLAESDHSSESNAHVNEPLGLIFIYFFVFHWPCK